MTSARPVTSVETTREHDVVTIRFRTEGGVNVFSSRVLGELGNSIENIRQDCRARFVVLRGEGRTFLAGADIFEMAHYNESSGKALSSHGHHVMDALASLPQATFALLNGHTLGGGCELALACDFRIITRDATIGQPETRLGLIPGWGGTLRLPRLVGPAIARRMLFSGEAASASEAERIGLVDEVVADASELDAALQRWMSRLQAASPKSIARIKRVLTGEDEVDEFSFCFRCSDSREGMLAFLEKRRPSWAAPCNENVATSK